MLTIKRDDIWDGGRLAHDAIIDSLNDAYSGWDVTVTNWFPTLADMPDNRILLGAFSWTDMGNRRKWVRDNNAIEIEGVCVPVTPTALARHYLKYKLGTARLRMRTSQYNHFVKRRKHPPMYAQPTRGNLGAYVDLQGAYWEVVKTVGLVPDVLPNKYFGIEHKAWDFPYPHLKMVRNLLVSVGLPQTVTEWNKGQLTHKRSNPRGTNLMLWGVTQDILHAIAYHALLAGAVYVHTDGYIVDSANERALTNTLDSWDFPNRRKYAGEYEVRGVADYRFPNKPFRKHAPLSPRPTRDSIIPDHSLWYMERWLTAREMLPEGIRNL